MVEPAAAIAEVNVVRPYLTVGLLLGFVLEGNSYAFCQLRAPDDPRSYRRIEPKNLSFHMYKNYLIVVEGSLARLPKRILLIDTGSSRTVLDRKIADELRLPGVVGTLTLPNGKISVEQVLLPNLELGPIRAKSLPVLTQDLSFIQKAIGVRIDAIVGIDVLRQSSFSVDYKTKEIVFGKIDAMRFAVPFETGPPFLTVKMLLNGQPFRLLVDTGAPRLMVFQSRVQDHLQNLPVGSIGTSSTLAGTLQRKQLLLHTVSIGTTELGSHAASIVMDQKDNDHDFDGLMALPALGLTQITFDFEHNTFGWKL